MSLSARRSSAAGHGSRSRWPAASRVGSSPKKRAALHERITCATELESVHGAELVIEAIVEDLTAKRQTFKSLDDAVDDRVILASNTSSIPIAELVAATNRPDRVLGLHFFAPVPVMKLVEVVAALDTAEAAISRAVSSWRSSVRPRSAPGNRSGFIVNMLLVPYLMAAVRMYEDGFASREDIDSDLSP
jgi:3-hydroxybutyryl-CoA dehydrogenase